MKKREKKGKEEERGPKKCNGYVNCDHEKLYSRCDQI